MIKADVVADSVSPESIRLTTFRLRYPRFIHAEFMTHRVISRNASSSRALPVAKLLEEVRTTGLRAEPVLWGSEKKGMQVGSELESEDKQFANEAWASAAQSAAEHAEWLMSIGVHKSICNRVLEPFSHINVVASATEWDNFFGLRLDTAAEPTMRALAVAMWEARLHSEPSLLQPGDWHLPFVDWLTDTFSNHDEAIKVSVARCARVSYQSFETGKRSTVEEDLRLYDRLLGAQPLHASPAEHQATPDTHIWSKEPAYWQVPKQNWHNPHQHGNFTGWRQHRKMLPGENKAPLPKEYVK